MEESGKWIKTKQDGILLFKNITFALQEVDKEEKKADGEYDHNEENALLSFFPEDEYFVGKKLFHGELNTFCTVSERVTDDEGKTTHLKIRIDAQDIETEVENNKQSLSLFQTGVPFIIRICLKAGGKFLIKSRHEIGTNFNESIKAAITSAGYKSNLFKCFNKEKMFDKDTTFEQIYESGKDTIIYAFESMGTPKKWKRFPTTYDYGTWSNSGNSCDGIVFVAQKNVSICGFVAYAAKDDPEYELKYKLTIDGVVREEGPPRKCTDWEDKFYKSIFFEDCYDVSQNARIQITIWISKCFANSS